eukprot:303102_1
MMSSVLLTKQQYILCGYCRRIENETNRIIPDDIVHLCYIFYFQPVSIANKQTIIYKNYIPKYYEIEPIDEWQCIKHISDTETIEAIVKNLYLLSNNTKITLSDETSMIAMNIHLFSDNKWTIELPTIRLHHVQFAIGASYSVVLGALSSIGKGGWYTLKGSQENKSSVPVIIIHKNHYPLTGIFSYQPYYQPYYYSSYDKSIGSILSGGMGIFKGIQDGVNTFHSAYHHWSKQCNHIKATRI